MPKIRKPDLSKPCLLCRFEISVLIPENKSNSFNDNLSNLIKELTGAFGKITPYFDRTDSLSKKDDRMAIEILVLSEDHLTADKFFQEKIPVWKQQFGQEEFRVLSSDLQNWA